MITRLMKESDLDRVMAIDEASFAVPWSRKSLEDDLRGNPAARYLVIEEDGKVIGFGGMWFVLDECQVTNVAVDPACRGRGVGTALMDAMVQLAADSGMSSMTLEVRRSNEPAIRLYAAHNFRKVGCRKGYYEDNHEDAVIMTAIDLPEGHPENDPFLVIEE